MVHPVTCPRRTVIFVDLRYHADELIDRKSRHGEKTNATAGSQIDGYAQHGFQFLINFFEPSGISFKSFSSLISELLHRMKVSVVYTPLFGCAVS